MTYFAFKLSDIVFIMLINVKMPTIVGILTFMTMINFMISLVGHEKRFITSGPECHEQIQFKTDRIPAILDKSLKY